MWIQGQYQNMYYIFCARRLTCWGNINLLKFKIKTKLEMIAKIMEKPHIWGWGWMASNKQEGFSGSSSTHTLTMEVAVATISFPAIVQVCMKCNQGNLAKKIYTLGEYTVAKLDWNSNWNPKWNSWEAVHIYGVRILKFYFANPIGKLKFHTIFLTLDFKQLTLLSSN